MNDLLSVLTAQFRVAEAHKKSWPSLCVAGLSRVALFYTATSRQIGPVLKQIDLAAEALGIKLQTLDVRRSPKHFEPAERPTKFDLVTNLKAAKQIGVNIPVVPVASRGQGDQVKFTKRIRTQRVGRVFDIAQ